MHQPENYRGISFLNVVSKICKGILLNGVERWLQFKNILTEYPIPIPIRFRKRYSGADNVSNLASIALLKTGAEAKDCSVRHSKQKRASVKTEFYGYIKRLCVDTRKIVFEHRSLCLDQGGSELFLSDYAIAEAGLRTSPIFFFTFH